MEMTEAVNAEFFEQLGKGKVVPLVPRGISMLPFIQGGRDMVLIHKEEKVGIGDIVLVTHDGRLILHRVYAIDGTRLTLMGDGNLKGKETVDKSEVLGTVKEIIKAGGSCRTPHKAWFWRHSLPLRWVMLKLRRKWYKMRGLNPE